MVSSVTVGYNPYIRIIDLRSNCKQLQRIPVFTANNIHNSACRGCKNYNTPPIVAFPISLYKRDMVVITFYYKQYKNRNFRCLCVIKNN